MRLKFLPFVLFTLVLSLLLSSCVKDLAKLNVVYQNNFEDYQLDSIKVSGWVNGNFGPISDIKITDYNGTKVLGRFNNNRIQLILNHLPKHVALNIQFDLYLHDNWKNDLWKMTFNGSDYLLTGFSNDSSVQQSYPNWLGNGSALSPAGGNAFTTNLPGACRLATSSHGTSQYKMDRTITNSDDSFTFECSDAALPFNNDCEISWSMDNLKITTINN
jgi:hypothetical protein